MQPYALSPESQSTASVYEEVFFTLTMTRVLPEGAKHTATFDALGQEGLKVLDDERKLGEAILTAQAGVQAADVLLNRFVDRLSGVLAGFGEGRPGTRAYELFFGDRPPSSLKRFVLGEQLEIMRGWLAKLDAASQASLKALAPDLKKLIEGADAAKAGLVDARAKLQAFRQTGSRKAYFDKANATRRAAYGELSKLPFEKPELQLGADFADQFFRLGPRGDRPEPGDPLAALRAEITEAEQALAGRRQELADLEAQALRDAQDAAARAEKEKKLAELEAQSAAVKAEKEALSKELGRSGGRRPPGRRK